MVSIYAIILQSSLAPLEQSTGPLSVYMTELREIFPCVPLNKQDVLEFSSQSKFFESSLFFIQLTL